ncbi:alpha/beta hydrolase [Paenibacillus sp. WQ 127069]|uniref:Alpha/beta hydrolase n=1 Tax=Paenibacillus baimaensis TaxID=2982185 RepID=A0ABT2UIP7_9BACL|nr:alpha/beta hydrolase [Paenibacillus sp. WQ 127069]MCU6794488.1 alpha/beta hydrolase [Paenibacillus sp. WQ 127069]
MVIDVAGSEKNPTIVLIHGSWLGGWSWRDVSKQLTVQGYHVLAPTLTGLGERKHLLTGNINLSVHIEDIVNLVLFKNITNVVLVGHSYGAVVAAGAADRLFGRVDCELVIVDGFITKSGESIMDRYPDVHLLMQRFLSSDPTLVEPPPVESFGLTDTQIAGAISRFLTKMPLATHTEQIHYSMERQAQISRSYIYCTEFPLFHQTASLAAEQGWRCFNISAGHMAPITHPKQISDLIIATMSS